MRVYNVGFTFEEAGPRSAVGRAPDSVRGPGFDSQSGHIYFRSPPADMRGSYQLLAKYVHEVLVDSLGCLSLPRKSVVRLHDRPDMNQNCLHDRRCLPWT